MNKKMNIVLVLMSCLWHLTVSEQNYCESVPDYYWRDFRTCIPFDAVPGGTDKLGSRTFIGQAMIYPWGPLPASIYNGKIMAVASAALKTEYTEKNIKILCSGSHEKFKWIPTDIDKINLITNCQLVLGGVDNGYQENIGRINYEEEVVLGKVIRKPLNHDGLWIPTNGTEIKLTSYEVLAYDCKN